MMLLFLALMIVYIVWYQVKGNDLKQSMQTQNTWVSSVQITSKSWGLAPAIGLGIDMTGTAVSMITGNGASNTTWVIVSVVKPSTGTTDKNTNIRLLSGTSLYYGSIAIIEKLGIKYQYALADEKGIWYIYLGTPSYDFTSIAKALKGNLHTLTTEQDLIQNKLFGNKVVFINLPEYKDKQVLMLLYLDEGIRLVQMEYSMYHKSKAYIKSLFID